MKQFLYVMESESGLIKIGVSMNPKSRRAAIETATGFHVNIVELFGPFNEAVRIEEDVHLRLKKYRKRGEWFDCSPEIASIAVRSSLYEFADVEQDDADDAHGAEHLAKLVLSDFLGCADDANRIVDECVYLLNESSKRFELLTEEFAEALSLLDFYGEQVIFLADACEKLVEKNSRLESELESIR